MGPRTGWYEEEGFWTACDRQARSPDAVRSRSCYICPGMGQNLWASAKFVLTNEAVSVRFCRFTAVFAELDPERRSVLGDGRQGGACVRKSEIRRACLDFPSQAVVVC